jgi:hypothetical protein
MATLLNDYRRVASLATVTLPTGHSEAFEKLARGEHLFPALKTHAS